MPENNQSGMAAKFNSINSVMDRFMPILAPTGIICGIIFPAVFVQLRPYIPWLFGTMTLTGALKLKFRDLAQAIASPLPVITFFLTAHVFMPVITLLISRLIFGGDQDTISGYVLIYSAPTAVSSFIWVTIYRGDSALCLALILLDAVLAPLIVPFTVRLLLGTEVVMDMSGMALSLVGMVLIPTIIGVTANETSRGAIPKAISPYFGPVSKICLALVIAANSSAVAPQINFENTRMYLIALMCIVFTTLGFTCGKFAGLLGGRSSIRGKPQREKQVTIFFTAGLRNISASMTLGIEFFPAAAALPTVLGIVFQQTLSAVMGKLYMGKKSGS